MVSYAFEAESTLRKFVLVSSSLHAMLVVVGLSVQTPAPEMGIAGAAEVEFTVESSESFSDSVSAVPQVFLAASEVKEVSVSVERLIQKAQVDDSKEVLVAGPSKPAGQSSQQFEVQPEKVSLTTISPRVSESDSSELDAPLVVAPLLSPEASEESDWSRAALTEDPETAEADRAALAKAKADLAQRQNSLAGKGAEAQSAADLREQVAQQAAESERQVLAASAVLADQVNSESERLEQAEAARARERQAAVENARALQLERDERARQQAVYSAAAAAALAQAKEQSRLQAEQEARANRMAKEQALSQQKANSAAVGGGEANLRRLDQIRQRPGNPKPTYSNEDRLEGRAGAVSFAAYISAEGLPTQIQLLQSSGHRSLDLKTLTAIKQWRFFPGQEGWVEIPFNWDLKGGAKELPVLLRR